MRITKKLLKETLIPIYEKALVDGKKMNHKRFKKYLYSNEIAFGICYKASSLFYKKLHEISNLSYIKKHIKYDARGENFNCIYWWKIPFFANTKKEAVECIQKRIEILKSL